MYLWFVCMFYGAAVTVLYLLALEGCKAAVSVWWLQDEGRISPWEEFGAAAPFPGEGGDGCDRCARGWVQSRDLLSAPRIFPCKSITYSWRHLFVSKQHSAVCLQGWSKWKILLFSVRPASLCLALYTNRNAKHKGKSTDPLWIIQITMDGHIAPILPEGKSNLCLLLSCDECPPPPLVRLLWRTALSVERKMFHLKLTNLA